VMSLHDINQAAQFADRLLVMAQGRLVAEGAPEAVLTAGLLRDVFRVDAEVTRSPSGRPLCVPVGAAQAAAAPG
jgi:iron complex transport system ATP-binding protein